MNTESLPFSHELDTGNKELSDALLVLGFLSIAGSIAAWAKAKQGDQAHGERFGIFVGLWAPTFFILSDRLARKKG